MLENVQRNLHTWDKTYGWPEHGGEWRGQAALCGIPYEAWKESLVQHLIAPHVDRTSLVLEIAAGHGRWTEYLVRSAAHVTAVDISASCLSYCRSRFQACANIDYFLTDGDVLPRHVTGLIDFVWSYDSFVHMDQEVIRRYLIEIRRVLAAGGSAMIHHANVDDPATHRQDGSPGWRSAMSASLMCDLAHEAGLAVISQFTYWDTERKIGVPRFGDRITHLKRQAR